MTEVEISGERFEDLCFVVNALHLTDADIEMFCLNPDHAFWLREHVPDVQIRSDLGPRRYFLQFDNMTTALLYKLTWGRG